MYKRLALPILSAIFAVFVIFSIFKANDAKAQFTASINPATTFASLGTSFTYQGHLTDGGQPANGTYDFIFNLYDSEPLGSGTLVGSIPLNDQDVIDGMFTLLLDFGEVFDGTALWLEIQVRPGDSQDPYTTLEPRQALSATPYASYATKAGSVPWGGINQIPAGFSDDIDNDTLGDLTCDNNQIAKWNGTTWACAVDLTGGSSGWSLTGNAGTTAGTNFLGTTDDEPLELHVNNQQALRLESGGSSPNIIAGYGGNSAGISGATVGGGGRDMAVNQAGGEYSTVSGGAGNTAAGYASAVGGGEGNSSIGSYSTLGGGANNAVDGNYATISGGQNNSISATHAAILGGQGNVITQPFGTIAGGANNSIYADYAVIGGGYHNYITGAYGTIAGGGPSDLGNPTSSNNQVLDDYGTVSGGGGNVAGSNVGPPTEGTAATVSGGQDNTASGSYATSGGGTNNTASGYGATVGGGVSNSNTSNYAVIAGGTGNTASGTNATVSGGSSNTAGQNSAAIGGGQSNTAGGAYSSISGGYNNQVVGTAGVIPGGFQNYVSGNYGFAAGYQARAEHQGSFVWSDFSSGAFTSTGIDQFLIQAAGGVGIGTNTPTEQLSVGGNAAIQGEGRLIARGIVTSTTDFYRKGLQKPSAIDAAGNYIYVTAWATNTLSIIDVSDPDYPKPITYTTSSLQGPLDIQVVGGLAFIPSEQSNRLVIIDVSDPAKKLKAIGSSDPRHMSHPQAVYVSGNHAYVASYGENYTGDKAGLFIFDVSDPTMVLAVGFTDTNLDRPTDVFVSGDHAYVTSMNNNSLAIFDISEPDNILSKGLFSDAVLLEGPRAVHVRGSYAYVLAENAGRLVTLDISDPTQITLVDSITSTLTHPMSLFLSGDYAYVAYAGDPGTADLCGLAVFDVSDPADIQVLSEIDMSDSQPEPEKPVAVSGNGRSIYVANENHWSVTIFDINHLMAPAVTAGTIQADHLEALGDAQVDHNLSVGDGLNVGPGGALIEGQLAVAGPENNYILGNLSLGAAGFIDEAEDFQEIYPTHQLDVHGHSRFRISDEHSLIMSSSPTQGAFFDFTSNNFGTSYTPTARVHFEVPDPYTHTTEIEILTQSASDTYARGRASFGEEIYFYNVAPDLSLRTTITMTKSGDVLPGVDNTYLLGDANHRWEAVYAANGTIQTSDARWKENIANLEVGLEEIQRLRPISFRWKDAPDRGQNYGLVAQEVIEVLPELVSRDGTPGTPLGMNYSEFVPVLIRAVQEQQVEIETQAEQIASLEMRLAALEGSSDRNRLGSGALSPLNLFGIVGLVLVAVVIARRKH